MKLVAINACAKINLGLAVLGKRSDGYHELRTVYQSIALADRLEVLVTHGPREVRLETSGFPVPAGRQNLAARAAEAALQELRLRARVSIFLEKRIPPGSGLGGASSDAAAVLRAVLSLSGRELPMGRLLHLAAALGSDVPFFLIGGRALGLGRGEEVYPLPESPRRYCVVFFPGQGMDTAEAYRRLRRPRLTPPSASPTIELFCGAVNESAREEAGSDRRVGPSVPKLANDFEPLLFREFPELARVKRALFEAGAEQASLSGSGSAVFGLFRDRATARAAAELLQARGKQVFLTRTFARREFAAQFPQPGNSAADP
ncbi:MAG: 4-(cytidine 5'-diphospho)-2-C-methyl-D-erythritol kinase [Terriglobia bacterium]